MNISEMTIINLAASFFVLLGIFIYKLRFPHKKINFLFLLILISLLPLISMLRPGDYESGDFNIHIYRSMAFYDSLAEGNLMPSWAGELNATYGYHLFIFINTLPYYVISFFHFLGFSFITSLKFYLALCFTLSGIFMYLWTKRIFKNSLAAFASSIFYLFAPYHLVDLHFRATVGEILIFALVPLLFYYIHLLFETRKLTFLVLSSFIFGLSFLIHQAMALFLIPITIAYSLFLKYSQKISLKRYVSLMLFFPVALLVSMSAWFPHAFLSQFTLSSILSSEKLAFPSVSQLLFSPWRFGFLFQGPTGELSFAVGYIHLFIIFFSTYLLIRKKIKKTLKLHFLFWLFIIYILLFFISPFSGFIWNNTPIIRAIQFSYRLLVYVALVSSVIAGYIVLNLKKNSLFIATLLFFTITATILNWGHRRVIPEITDTELRRNLPFSTYQGEGLAYMGNSAWWKDKENLWITKIPPSHLEALSGQAEIKEVRRTSTTHEYIVLAKTDTELQENTMFFPGWKIKNQNGDLAILHDKGKYPAMIFKLPKGLHLVTVSYEDILSLKIAKLITLTSIAIISLYLLMKGYRFLYRK